VTGVLLLATAPASAGAPYDLESITVQASRLDTLLPARTEIPREEIVESHKDEFTGILELTPGMNVRQGGRGEMRADMRGFDQRATLFTLNGVPVFEPYNGIVNLDLFPVEMLQNVEVVRGPSSSLFGPNGMAGTVKMTTLRPADPIAAAVSTTWRNSDYWDVRASAAAKRGQFSGALGGRFLTTGDYPLSGAFDDRPPSRRRLEDGGTRLNSDRETKSAFGGLDYVTPGHGHLHFTGLGSVGSFGIPPSTVEFRPQFRRNDHQEFDHLQLGLDQPLSATVGVSAAVFYSRYDTRESLFTSANFDNKVLTTEGDSNEVGGIGHCAVAMGDSDTLSVGGQVRRADATISDTMNGQLNQADFTTASAAFENVYFLAERVRLVSGLSYDVQTGGGRGTDWELDPQGGVAVEFGRYGELRAGVSRKIRFPTLRELFDPAQGNPDLKPEKALVYEVGHRLQTHWFYVTASLFRSDVSDLIENGTQGTSQQAMNLEDATLQGVESAVGGVLGRFGRLDLNYTYLDATARKNTPLGGSSFSDIQHKPAHRFNGVLRIFFPYEFAARLEGIYTSDQVETFGTDVRADEFGVFNVQVSKAFGEHLEVFAGADNVLDADYEQKLGSPEPGRWEYVGLRARY